MARRNVTDRAHRYRANAMAPAGPKVCALCGSRSNIVVDHKDGHPDHTERKNLRYLCKSCNTARGFWYKQIGKGRLTHQYNPASGEVPTYQQYAWAVSQHVRGEHDEGGAIIHATPVSVRKEYASRIAAVKRSRGRMADDDRWNPANPWPFSDKRLSAKQTTAATGGAAHHAAKRKPAASKSKKKTKAEESAFLGVPDESAIQEGFKRGKSLAEILRGNPGWRRFYAAGKKAAASGRYISAADAWVDYTASHVPPKGLSKGSRHWSKQGEARASFEQGYSGKKNPAAGAAEAFEEFHGHPSSELVTVTKKVHRHEHLAAAGELRGLTVRPVSKILEPRHIGGLKGAILAFNEAKNQLFIEGGDQYLSDAELKAFGISKPHELETLGKVLELDYFTTKSHLGKEGGEAVYSHRLRTTNEDGKHIVVTIARYPDLIYRVLDQQMEFSGGSYEIRAEGIDK